MTQNYRLLFDDDVYINMSQYSYDAVQWMNMDCVLTKASEIQRSKKKFEELFRRGVLLTGDTLTMNKTQEDGSTIAFSATVGQLSSTASSRANNGYLFSVDRSNQSTFDSVDV